MIKLKGQDLRTTTPMLFLSSEVKYSYDKSDLVHESKFKECIISMKGYRKIVGGSMHFNQ